MQHNKGFNKMGMISRKVVDLSKESMGNISQDGSYVSGFISSAEKLEKFLKNFQEASGSSFTIRRSEAKPCESTDPDERQSRKYKPGYLGKGWQRLPQELFIILF